MDAVAGGPSLQTFKADFFRALAHPVRIRILETLAAGEHTVHELQLRLGREQPVVSQQLAVLRAKNIVTPRKVGTTVKYALSDPLVTKLLAVAREIFDNRLVNTQTMLKELRRERRR
ncbi:MAG: ArsR/SmtB family transcription factor [Betaproteobacteria bacterium]